VKIEYAFIQLHLPPVTVPVSEGHPFGALVAGPMTSLVYEKGKWMRNDSPDGGEFVEIPEPPPEVIAYLESLLPS
jgi:hypothetical protein